MVKCLSVSSRPSSPKTKLKEKKKMKNSKNAILYLTRGSVIAALYVVLTIVSAIFGLSSGVIQLRLSEALTVLPLFLPEAVPGLYVGCLIANLITGAAPFDLLFGSLATLLGALGTRLIRHIPRKIVWLSTLPTILSNALIIPPVLIFAYGATDAYWFITLTVAIGEALSAGALGYLLYLSLKKCGIEKML